MSISAINARNKIKGIIRNIQLGDVVSEVELETAAGMVTSVITTSSLRLMDLQIGAEAIAVALPVLVGTYAERTGLDVHHAEARLVECRLSRASWTEVRVAGVTVASWREVRS